MIPLAQTEEEDGVRRKMSVTRSFNRDCGIIKLALNAGIHGYRPVQGCKYLSLLPPISSRIERLRDSY